MKIILLTLFVCYTSALAFAQQNDDHALVYEAVENYVDALYKVEPNRIKRSVHPNLTKKGFWRKSIADPFGPEQSMTYQQLYDLAGKWNAKGNLPADAPKKIEILDVQDQTAAAKLTAQWGTDYFHLAKYDGTWMIINVLWQSPAQGSLSGEK
jgi:hypothetical protein